MLQDKAKQLFFHILLIEVGLVFSGVFITAGQIHFHVIYIDRIFNYYKATVYIDLVQVEVAHLIFATQYKK